MKPAPIPFVFCLLTSAFLSPLTHAQPAIPNRVLELDGNGSYVELPPNIFKDLTEATVEGWVKWRKISQSMKVFDFGRAGQPMRLTRADSDFRDLRFGIGITPQGGRTLDVQNIIPDGEWFHFAAISGREGMRLYVNGSLMARNAYAGSFAALGNNDQNSFGLGRVAAPGQPVYFDG